MVNIVIQNKERKTKQGKLRSIKQIKKELIEIMVIFVFKRRKEFKYKD